MGVAFDRIGDHKGAQTHYRQALTLAPASLSVRNNLGLSMALAGEYDAAITLLKEVADDPAAAPRERQNLALAHGLAGDFNAAARVGRIDLQETAVQNNVACYRYLQTLSGPAKANATAAASKGD